MKMRNLICLLLAVFLLAGCVGCVSGAIGLVALSVDKPVIAGTPDTSATTTTDGIDVQKPVWKLGGSTVTGTFEGGKAYTVSITVSNKTGYDFSDYLRATVNGQEADITLASNGKSAVVEYTFGATDSSKAITEITIKDLESPKPAATPDKTITIDTNEGASALKTDSVSWSPADSTFLLDKEYTVTMVLKPSSTKYTIASSPKVKIGSTTLSSSAITQKDGKITITYKYPKTEPLGTISSMTLGVNAPTVGAKPSTSVTTNSNMFTAKVSWYPNDAVFHPDTSYIATITVTQKYGYVFASSLSATINGAPVSPITGSGDTRTMSYTFGQLSSVDLVDVTITQPATGDIAQTAASSVVSTPSGSTAAPTIAWFVESPQGGTKTVAAGTEFEAGSVYIADVTIRANGNVGFDTGTKVTVNGKSATIKSISSDYKTIVASYTFPKTSFIPNPIEVIKEFFKLMLLMFNPSGWAFA